MLQKNIGLVNYQVDAIFQPCQADRNGCARDGRHTKTKMLERHVYKNKIYLEILHDYVPRTKLMQNRKNNHKTAANATNKNGRRFRWIPFGRNVVDSISWPCDRQTLSMHPLILRTHCMNIYIKHITCITCLVVCVMCVVTKCSGKTPSLSTTTVITDKYWRATHVFHIRSFVFCDHFYCVMNIKVFF